MGRPNQRITNTIYESRTIADSQQMLAVSSAAVQLAAAAVPDLTMFVVIQAQVAAVRYTTDGSTPVGAGGSANGDILEVGERQVLSKDDAEAAQFIRDASTDAKISSKAQTY